MRRVSNPFLRNLMRSNQVAARRRSRFDGNDIAPVQNTQAINTVAVPERAAASTINVGRRSSNSVETPLHNNAVVLKLKNNSDTLRADLVLSAGRFSGDYQAQLITDGQQDYPNDDGQAVNVDVSAEFGVDGTAQSWERILDYIRNDGLAIGTTRIEWLTNSQKMHKLRFKRVELFGDDALDHIFPQTYYDSKQYHDKLVDSHVSYVLDGKTVVKYSLVPGEEVLITFWITGQYESERILQDFVRQQGGSSLM
ncbi:MAG: hypothetical protein AAFR61_15125 [Bacteroidota bacterium]